MLQFAALKTARTTGIMLCLLNNNIIVLHGTLDFQTCQAPERRNRKLASLFQSKKKWGSAEELAPIEEERSASHQLMIPAFRTRKFSR